VRKENQHLEFEIESLKRTHNEGISSFEKKFMQLSRELDQLSSQNGEMREREKTFKKKFHDLEVENLEWREKYKYSEQRYTDQGRRLTEVANETRHYPFTAMEPTRK
jgi:chromosome segregation ATPase